MEKNELSKNARGGTELMLERLHKSLDPEFLSQFQIIPSRVRELDSTKKKVLWLHDLPLDPEAQHLKDEAARDNFDLMVFVSNWQYQQFRNYLGIPFDSTSIVIENGIEPIEAHEKPTDVINLVYFTTPHRGLDLLYPVFDYLYNIFGDRIALHVFSSFSIYGWEQRDKPYEELFEKLKDHPGITYYGAVSNEEIREHLKKMHILAYPSIWEETSCLQLIEAMSAGLLCVHPNLGALPDTSGGITWMYHFDQNPNIHANRFAAILEQAVNYVQTDTWKKNGKFVKMYADIRFNWTHKASQWKAALNELSISR